MEEVPENATFLQRLRANLILLFLILGVILGYVVGVACILTVNPDYKSRITMSIGFPGELLLHVIECMALPLAVAGLILAVLSMSIENCTNVVIQLGIAIIILKFVSTIVGLMFAVWIVPSNMNLNVYINELDLKILERNRTSVDEYLDVIRYFFPDNVITMTMMYYTTELIPDEEDDEMYHWTVDRQGKMEGGTDVFGVVLYSIAFGIALRFLLAKSQQLIRIFQTLNDMIIMLTGLLMYAAPLLSVFVIAGSVLEATLSNYLVDGIFKLLVAIVCAHIAQCLVVYPLIYFSLVWENPFKPILPYFVSIVMAYVTNSCWISFPVLQLQLDKKEEIPSYISKFVIPILQSLNKDGSAIYFTASLIFMYRSSGKAIDIVELLKISFVGGVTSFAGSGVPYRNILCVLMSVEILGLNSYFVPMFIAVDWIAGRTANVVNLIGDIYILKLIAVYNTDILPE